MSISSTSSSKGSSFDECSSSFFVHGPSILLPLVLFLCACQDGSLDDLLRYASDNDDSDTSSPDTGSPSDSVWTDDSGPITETDSTSVDTTDTGEDTGEDTGKDTSEDTGKDTGKDTGEDTGVVDIVPLNHKVYFGNSLVGNNLDFYNLTLVSENASVPNLLQLSQPVGAYNTGDLIAVFCDTLPPNSMQVFGLSVSTDMGATWMRMSNISIDSMMLALPNSRPVDPSIVQMADGTLRLYVADFSTSKAGNFYALSTDLVSTVFEGVVYSGNTNITDPDVLDLSSGLYLLAYSEYQSSVVVVSSDPLDFIGGQLYVSTFNGCAVPGVVEDPTSNEILLYCSDNSSNIYLHASNDQGGSWNYRGEITGMGSYYGGPSVDPFVLSTGQIGMLVSGEAK